MDHLDYIKWLLFFAWIPTGIIWLFYWRMLIKYKTVFLFCFIGSTIFGYFWDLWAINSWLWRFSPEHTLTVDILGVPLEEYIFYISETLLYGSLALVLRDMFNKRIL